MMRTKAQRWIRVDETLSGVFVDGLVGEMEAPAGGQGAAVSTDLEAENINPTDDEPVASRPQHEFAPHGYAEIEGEAEGAGYSLGEVEDVPGYLSSGEHAYGIEAQSEQVGGADGKETVSITVNIDGSANQVEVPLLDAWYAQFASPLERAGVMKSMAQSILRLGGSAANGNGAHSAIVGETVGFAAPAAVPDVAEVVIGPDDRTQVTNTTAIPWRRICSLLITSADGNRWIGTGWLIGPRTVITAGHCVYMHASGGWARSIEVIPGRNASNKPLGSCVATDFRSVRGWVERQKRACDYGAIILPANFPFGSTVGTFDFAQVANSQLTGLRVNLAGYPGDKPTGTQWFHSRVLTSITPRTLVYDIDSAGGQSGAPVWWRQGTKRYVVGIHTNGATSGNSATRIAGGVFTNLDAWRQEG